MRHELANRPQSSKSLARLVIAAGAAIAGAAIATTAAAQVHQGGKGGGLPRGGPAKDGSGRDRPTGGGALPDPALARHVVERLTFGADAHELALIRTLGVEGYIRHHLHPEAMAEDPALESRLANLGPLYNPVGDPQWEGRVLMEDYLQRTRWSRRQLEVVMGEFWRNHFNTGLATAGGIRRGVYSSLDHHPVSGHPTVCYQAAGYEYPECRRWDGSSWQDMSVANPSWGIGAHISLRHNPVTGRPAFSHHATRSGELWLQSWNGSSFVAETVDAAGEVGAWSSLRFGANGEALIAYYDASGRDLKLARNGGGDWDVVVVDAAGDVGQHASLALDRDGEPAIAYHDAGNGNLRYAEHRAGSWSYAIVDAIGDVGRWCSLAFDPASGEPAISYHDASNGDLRLATRGAGGWTITTIDAAGDVGDHSSLAFSPGGEPAIAYRDRDSWNQKYAERSGTGWAISTVDDSADMTGEWSTLGFDPLTGRARIASYNGSRFGAQVHDFGGVVWSHGFAGGGLYLTFHYIAWEAEQEKRFRERALGRFRDLLEVSATSPAMMRFLDNDTNRVGSGNENYARELLELHTLGVDGGYDQGDVESVARAFTGWTLSVFRGLYCDLVDRGFCYRHDYHDGAARTVLGIALASDQANVPASWMRQGREVLDLLARHPSTARHVCGKLVQKFVSDQPQPRLVEDCARTWAGTDGDVRALLATLFGSPELRDPLHFRAKVKTPLELVLSTHRALAGAGDGLGLYDAVARISPAVLEFDIPTGYREDGLTWVHPSSLLARWQWLEELSHATRGPTVDPYALVLETGLDEADAIVNYLAEVLVGSALPALESRLLVDCLSNGDPAAFRLDDPLTPARLRDTLGVLLGYPILQRQ